MLDNSVPQVILEAEQELHRDSEVTSTLSDNVKGKVEDTRDGRSSFVADFLFYDL